ncbi:MAG TPA: YbaB/EbfC family nucleoid-associated protein [Bacteroidia bacterium]|nr:YbaB/EbfC family nucleoid-associated protein [Bacteroidia bacterium]
MFGKLNEARQKAEEIKQRLETITVTGEAENGAVKVVATGNKRIKDIIIDDRMMADKEQLQDVLTVAVNRALEQADKVSESEMSAIASQLLPGLGNLFGK